MTVPLTVREVIEQLQALPAEYQDCVLDLEVDYCSGCAWQLQSGHDSGDYPYVRLSNSRPPQGPPNTKIQEFIDFINDLLLPKDKEK